MKVLCVLGRHHYGDPARGPGYEYVSFLPALRALGCEPVVFDSLDRAAYRNFSELNHALLATVAREAPDLVLCVLFQYEIWLETLDLIRAHYGVPVINWGTDDSWKYVQASRYQAPHVDVWASTNAAAVAQAARDGHPNFILTQWAASDTQLAMPLPAVACRHDVSFVGSAYGNRSRWIDGLRRRGIEVQCFGHGWPAGAVSAEAVDRIHRESRISLNFADSGLQFRGLWPYRSRQVKARVFEVPGAGGLLLTERADGLASLYAADREVVVFNDLDDLAGRIQQLLANPAQRDAIAVAGHLRTCAEHTYTRRFAALLAAASAARRTTKPIPQPPLHVDMDALAMLHGCSPAMLTARRALLGPARWLFGPTRGPRAARRLAYELSWRFAGARTFTARGLPGRMFYPES